MLFRSGIGDLDGDGVADIVVGAEYDDDGPTGAGAVWVLFLNTNGTVKSHQKISATQGGFTGILDPYDIFGSSVAGIGDLDGDGVTDFVCGAMYDNDGGEDFGAVYVINLYDDPVIYVDADAGGPGDGTSWLFAYNDLADALWDIYSRGDTDPEVWVAEGTYLPTTDTDRYKTFELKNGIRLFGGFAGIETSFDQRDLGLHPTILSGDIGTPGDPTDNSHHVVTGFLGTGDEIIDGFTIRDGYGGTQGGGVYSLSTDFQIANCIVTANQAGDGAGLSSNGQTLTLLNVLVHDNTATNVGGGFAGDGYFANCTITRNTALVGGGFSGTGSTFFSTIISGNSGYFPEVGPNSGIFTKCLITGSGGSGIGWDTNLGTDGGGNIDADPRFSHPGSGNFRLALGSPAIDSGANLPGLPFFDLDGEVRIQNSIVDMGPYEGAECQRLYVSAAATGNNTGLDWNNAFTDLHEAIWTAHLSGCTDIVVYVAAGTYVPTTGTDRTAAFYLQDGIRLYGGFAGNETSWNERSVVGNPTILSGDIGVPGDPTDNCYNVVVALFGSGGEVLDGFIIQDGYADGPSAQMQSGGGMYCELAAPEVANCIFRNNWASYSGGAVACGASGFPSLVNTIVTGNEASGTGGGIAVLPGGRIALLNCSLSRNTAMLGGGCVFNANFSTLTNTIIQGNTVSISSPEILNTGQTVEYSHCLIGGCGGSGAGWDTVLGIDGGGNLDADPLFAEPDAGDLHLTLGSPCLDAGKDQVSALPDLDLDGTERIQGGAIDMGVYEYPVSGGPWGWFARDPGIPGTTLPGRGIAWGDYDKDGLQDFYLTVDGTDNILFRNLGGGVFQDPGVHWVVGEGPDRSVAWADLENDGDLDIFVANDSEIPKSLVIENRFPDPIFTDSDLFLNMVRVTGVPLGDYDRDGYVDIYAVSEALPNGLFHGNGSTYLQDVTTPSLEGGIKSRGAVWFDHDNDGDPDLMVIHERDPIALLDNNGGVFTNIAAGPLLTTNGKYWSLAAGDFDNDGLQDVYLGSDNANRLLHNLGGGAFADVTAPPLDNDNNTFGVVWLDFDNDGDLDLYLNNDGPNALLRNDGPAGFTEVADPVLQSGAHGRGAAAGDFDNDGRLDLFLVNDRDPQILLENKIFTWNRWVELRLTGRVSNRAAIGARIEVFTGDLVQTREISGGSGYMSQNALVAHFGLGAAGHADSVRIHWPSGILQRIVTPMPANRIYDIVEWETSTPVTENDLPRVFAVESPFPNPFNPTVTIRYAVPRASRVALEVYDVKGRRMKVLADERHEPGIRTRTWDGSDDAGRPCASGVYFCRVTADGFTDTKRMVMVK
ncbi:MAG: FG-GAP-like repeat-containing protein [bacterium]